MAEKYITIAEFIESHEAHLAKIKLNAMEIECILLDENVRVLRKTLTHIVPVRLQVLERDREMALRVLRGEFDEPIDDEELERQALEAGEQDF